MKIRLICLITFINSCIALKAQVGHYCKLDSTFSVEFPAPYSKRDYNGNNAWICTDSINLKTWLVLVMDFGKLRPNEIDSIYLGYEAGIKQLSEGKLLSKKDIYLGKNQVSGKEYYYSFLSEASYDHAYQVAKIFALNHTGYVFAYSQFDSIITKTEDSATFFRSIKLTRKIRPEEQGFQDPLPGQAAARSPKFKRIVGIVLVVAIFLVAAFWINHYMKERSKRNDAS